MADVETRLMNDNLVLKDARLSPTVAFAQKVPNILVVYGGHDSNERFVDSVEIFDLEGPPYQHLKYVAGQDQFGLQYDPMSSHFDIYFEGYDLGASSQFLITHTRSEDQDGVGVEFYSTNFQNRREV